MIPRGLTDELERNGIRYKTDLDLKGCSTFRIGGRCALAVMPEDTDSLVLAVDAASRSGTPFFVIGKGSNTLFFDGYIDKVMIFTSGVSQISVNGEYVTASAGTGLIRLASFAADTHLSGLEFASGIPGSVGGALYMNAGAYGSCMEDVTVKSRAYDRASGSIITLEEHGFGYRESVYKREQSLVCLEAVFKLCVKDKDGIHSRMRELSEQRRQKQPLEFPSAGSYFKRPEGDFAGRLIEACGLKGARIGGAEVSEKHAGFIINRGNASFEDVMRLEALVKEKVFKEYGIELEREVEVVR